MLDISHTLSLLPDAGQMIVLGTPLECKELDAICDFDRKPAADTEIKAVTIGVGIHNVFHFTRQAEAAADASFGVPVAEDMSTTHIRRDEGRTFQTAVPRRNQGSGTEYPLVVFRRTGRGISGRTYKVEEVLPYMSKHIKRYAARYPKVSVTARNFDVTADVLRTKLKVKDGPARLFAVNAFNGQKLLITCTLLTTK